MDQVFGIHAGRTEDTQDRFFRRVCSQFASLFLSLRFVRAIGKKTELHANDRAIDRWQSLVKAHERNIGVLFNVLLLLLIFLLKKYTDLNVLLLRRSVIKIKLQENYSLI